MWSRCCFCASGHHAKVTHPHLLATHQAFSCSYCGLSPLHLCLFPLVYSFLSASVLVVHIFALRSCIPLTCGPHRPLRCSLFAVTILILLMRTQINITNAIPDVPNLPPTLCLCASQYLRDHGASMLLVGSILWSIVNLSSVTEFPLEISQ